MGSDRRWLIVACPDKRKTARTSYLARAVFDFYKLLTLFAWG